MPVLSFLTLIIGGAAAVLEPPPADTLRPPPAAGAAIVVALPDTTLDTAGADFRDAIATPAGVRRLAWTPIPVDTPTTRRRATDVDEWYARRLLVHRVTAFAVPALFAYQWWLGDKLWDQSTGEAEFRAWVRPAHRTNAKIIAGAFAVNAVTGAWNLWDSRHTQEGRTARWLHTAGMVGAMGGFTYAGVKLADDAKHGRTADEIGDARSNHRAVALTSMGVTLVSGVAMWIYNR